MGDQVKVSARLLDALDDEYLWAEEYEREFKNILVLQSDIAQEIARTDSGETNTTRGNTFNCNSPG